MHFHHHTHPAIYAYHEQPPFILLNQTLGAVFIDDVIASFHEVSEVLIVLSPGVLISA